MQCPICQEEAAMVCSACTSVAYCSVDHQTMDWKNHKEVCQPFCIEKVSEEMGLGWVATRDLQAGSILLEEAPIIQALSPESSHRICVTCAAKMERKRTCSTCAWPVCSDQCEKNPLHSDNECKEFALRQLKYPPPPSWTIGMVTFCLRAKGLKNRDPQKFQQLMALQDCLSISSVNEELKRLTENLPDGMNYPKVSGPSILNLDEIHKLLRISKVNGFSGVSMETVGISHLDEPLGKLTEDSNLRVYLKASRINHSCFPNCSVRIDPAPPHKIQIRTTTSVSKWEQLVTPYFLNEWHGFNSTIYRQLFFREKGFICKCKRCLDPTELGLFPSGIKCFSCSSHLKTDSDSDDDKIGFLVPADPFAMNSPNTEYKCHRCHVKVLFSKVKGTLPTNLDYVIYNIGDLVCKVPLDHKSLDVALTEYEGDPGINDHLHKNNWVIQGAMRMLIRKQMDTLNDMTEQELDRIVLRLEFLVKVDDKLYPGYLYQPKYEDLLLLNQAALFLSTKFGDGMNPEKREKLMKICEETEKEQINFLRAEWSRNLENEKLRVDTALKLMEDRKKQVVGLVKLDV